MSENKTVPTAESADAFLLKVEDSVRRSDALLLRDLMVRVTGEEPVMWGPSMVGFGTYHYKYDSGREGDYMLTGFSPRKTNLSIYLMDGFSGKEEQLARLGKHKTGKSCLYVNKLADIDMDVLEEMVKESVANMRAQYG